MHLYNPKIICPYYDPDNDLIMHFAKVYTNLCSDFNVEFDLSCIKNNKNLIYERLWINL